MPRFIAIVTLLALVLVPLTGARAQQKPYEINFVVSLTGPVAFVGTSEIKTLELVEGLVNRQGGIRGRPVKFVAHDDQSDPQVAVQLVSQLQAQKVPVIMGPTFTPTCAAAMALTAKGGPFMWCLSPGIYPPAGSYVLASAASLNDTILVLVRYMRERGWKRLGVLASTDASGQAYDQGVTFALSKPENKDVQIVAREYMNPSDISTAGQWTRIKSANPQAVLTLASGSAWGTMMRGYADLGLDLPVGGGQGNMSYAQLNQYKSFLPKTVYFPGVLSLVPGGVGEGPVKDAQTVFFRTFKEAGLRPDLGFDAPWDPAMLLVHALNVVGPAATAEQLRDYLVHLHGWVGINGVYDYRDGLQRGVAVNSLVIDQYDNAKQEFVPVSRAAGYLK